MGDGSERRGPEPVKSEGDEALCLLHLLMDEMVRQRRTNEGKTPRWPAVVGTQREEGSFGVTAERETLSASQQAHKPLVGEMLTEQDLDDLRHDLAGALVELFFGEVGDGVRHR